MFGRRPSGSVLSRFGEVDGGLEKGEARATGSASTCPSAESSPPDRAPSRAQGRCALARRASGDSAGGPRDPFEVLALPVRKPGFRSCRFPAHLPCLPFCWPLATAAGEQCHASGRNGIACFKSYTSVSASSGTPRGCTAARGQPGKAGMASARRTRRADGCRRARSCARNRACPP